MDNCRVVLVRPRIAANIGSVARVLRNLGASRLLLVAPPADPQDSRARLLASHAEDVLDNAGVVEELGEAIADCVLVAGTSARTGGLFRRQTVGAPEEILPHLVAEVGTKPVALVFGPERSGLSDAEVSRCHYLIQIPTASAWPALNLAQAVAICLYEMRRLWLASIRKPTTEPICDLAPHAAQEHMFAKLREALEAIHFLYGDKADALMHGLRHLLGKARLTGMEVKLLLGLARQVQWMAARAGSVPPPAE
jgi:tRNA/rRNA methyltransferase